MQYGLIGRTLKHSFSREIHEKLGYSYSLTELEPEDLDEFFKKRAFCGINVTIPYKETVIPYLDYIDESAEKIGACNTIVNKNGKLYGYNTDFYAAKLLIERKQKNIKNKKALILGTGGTSKTYNHVLKALGVNEIFKVSRHPSENEISYEEAYSKHSDAALIVNTTPVGMFPKVHAAAVDLTKFNNLILVVDAIYNPLKTELLYQAESMNIPCAGGLYMLCAQAVLASEFFGCVKADLDLIDKIYTDILKSKRNIVLIGMPGSGKSTIAAQLSDNYTDTDVLIEKEYGMTPKDILTQLGEGNFRQKESHIIESISLQNGLVIATGGGAVLRQENIKNLKRNGIIVYLNASLERLQPTDSRPLSQNEEMLKRIYEQRKEIYSSACDISVSADGSISETVDNLKEALIAYENTCN